MQPGEGETERLIKATHQVHRLHCTTGCPLHQVIDSADRDDPASSLVKGKTDIGKIGAGKDFGLRETVDPLTLLDNAHKGLLSSEGTVGLPELFLARWTRGKDMSRRQSATHQLD